MNIRTRPLWKSALAPAAVVLAGLSVSACGGADDGNANTAAAENVAVPADERTGDDAHVAAEMHNQMLNQADAAPAAMGDDQMGAAGMGNGQMGGMMDDMPMGGGNMAASKGGMGDHHMGMSGGSMNKSGTAKPAPMPKDKPMPMQDDM